MNIAASNLPSLVSTSSAKPVSCYNLPPNSLEDALLERMGMLAAADAVPSKPVVQKFSGGQTTGLRKWHAKIKSQMIAISKDRWMSIDEFAEEIGCDRDTIKNKVSAMASQGFLDARGHGHTRRFTQGANPKSKKPTRTAVVKKRRELIAKAISRPMALKEIIAETGIDRHTLQGDLHKLSRKGEIKIDFVGPGIPATYRPALKESNQ